MRALCFLLLLLAGCGSKSLKPDPSISAIEANYPTAEFYACGKPWLGLGSCFVKAGTSLDNVAFQIQGYYQGTVRLYSQDCGIDDSLRYQANQRIHYRLSGKAEASCLISFVVSPEYPSEEDQPIEIHSFKGHLWISVLGEGEIGSAFQSKVAEGWFAQIKIEVPDETQSVRVVFRGCGSTFDKTISPTSGSIVIDLSEVISVSAKTKCVLQGGLFLPQPHYVTWMVWGYDKRFVPLTTPALKLSKSEIEINADQTVSVISLDNAFEISSKTKFKFDQKQFHTLRLLTVAGRSILGIWLPSDGSFRWLR